MTGPCTESALVPVKSGLSLEAGSELAKVLNSGLATLHETPGLQRTYYGFEHENPTNLHLYNEWSKLEDHEAFMKSDAYGPFMKELSTVLAGEPTVFHVHFNPKLAASLPESAKIMQVMQAYFPASQPQADLDGATADFHKFFEIMEAEGKGQGYLGYSSGWLIEELEVEGEKMKVIMAAVGWTSVEDHMQFAQKMFQESQVFRESAEALRSAKGLKKSEMFHVTIRESSKGGAM